MTDYEGVDMPQRTTLDRIEDTPTSRRRLRQMCCWPDCTKLIFNEIPLCGAHLTVAAQLAEAENPHLYVRVPQPVETTPPAPVDGTVYVIRCGGFIKIGWTSDLTKRMRAYQPDTILLATMPGTRKDEHRLHKRFAHLRTHGREWYSIAPQITEYVAVMVREHGQPDPVTFAAKPATVPQPRQAQPIGQRSTRMVTRI